ncbi:MAG: hypothetical protein JSR60_08365 [Proteobacteria bacterium]|nr:hypothetical protein [Pseudomonadota bacterium]
MNWQIEFESDLFRPDAQDEGQTNPGIYGRELAEWLKQALAAKGIETGEPVAEDWGWILKHADCDIACGNMIGDDGPLIWSIFVNPRRASLLQRLRGQSFDRAAQGVASAIETVLAETGIAFRPA